MELSSLAGASATATGTDGTTIGVNGGVGGTGQDGVTLYIESNHTVTLVGGWDLSGGAGSRGGHGGYGGYSGVTHIAGGDGAQGGDGGNAGSLIIRARRIGFATGFSLSNDGGRGGNGGEGGEDIGYCAPPDPGHSGSGGKGGHGGECGILDIQVCYPLTEGQLEDISGIIAVGGNGGDGGSAGFIWYSTSSLGYGVTGNGGDGGDGGQAHLSMTSTYSGDGGAGGNGGAGIKSCDHPQFIGMEPRSITEMLVWMGDTRAARMNTPPPA